MFVGVCAVWSVCYIYVTTVCQSRLRSDAVSDYNWRLSIAKCARFGSLLGGVLLHESGILTKKTNESNFSVYFLEKEQEKRRCNNHAQNNLSIDDSLLSGERDYTGSSCLTPRFVG